MRRTVIEFRFDAATEARLRALIATLDVGDGRRVRQPHVSLAVIHEGDPQQTIDVARHVATAFRTAVATRLASVGAFAGPRGVVFLAPTASAELLALHAAVHAELDARGIASWDLYRPAAWMPHCTLAFDLPPDRVGPLVERVRAGDVFGPATLDAIVAVELEPDRDLAQFAASPTLPGDPPTLDVRPGVRLRPASADDAGELFALIDANRGHLRRWLPWLDHVRHLEDERAFLAHVAARGRAGGGAVFVVEEHGAAVGVCGFNWIDPANHAGEIGYWLAEGAQGRGLVTDGVARLVRHAFDDLGLARLTCPVCVDNSRSRAVPERLGFRVEGTLRHAEWLYDRFVDHVLYARVRGD